MRAHDCKHKREVEWSARQHFTESIFLLADLEAPLLTLRGTAVVFSTQHADVSASCHPIFSFIFPSQSPRIRWPVFFNYPAPPRPRGRTLTRTHARPIFQADWKEPIRAGVFDGSVLDGPGVLAISKLPTKQELMQRLAIALNSVPTKLGRSIKLVPTKVGRVVRLAFAEGSGEEEAAAPEAEAAEEAPAAADAEAVAAPEAEAAAPPVGDAEPEAEATPAAE